MQDMSLCYFKCKHVRKILQCEKDSMPNVHFVIRCEKTNRWHYFYYKNVAYFF